jgi:hypothetical protein
MAIIKPRWRKKLVCEKNPVGKILTNRKLKIISTIPTIGSNPFRVAR